MKLLPNFVMLTSLSSDQKKIHQNAGIVLNMLWTTFKCLIFQDHRRLPLSVFRVENNAFGPEMKVNRRIFMILFVVINLQGRSKNLYRNKNQRVQKNVVMKYYRFAKKISFVRLSI
jgi:hypothetical protein